MGRVRAEATVSLPPAEALELWADVRRWSGFVDQLATVVAVSEHWPTRGSEATWDSTRGGRGRVVERVEAYEAPPPAPEVAQQSRPGRLVTLVRDESLEGRQTATFEPMPEGTLVQLELDYELSAGGALEGLTDVLFIRRALRDSLRRTLGRFATVAARIL